MIQEKPNIYYILREAKSEIENLRQQKEVMSSKLEVYETMRDLAFGASLRPNQGMMLSSDIVRDIQRELDAIDYPPMQEPPKSE